MDKTLSFILALAVNVCFAQCPFGITLQNKGSLCQNNDTLWVTAANALVSIKWYKDGVLDTTIQAKVDYITSPNGITVGGGNGAGSAANQLNGAGGLWVDAKKNVYVADVLNFRIQKFLPGATSSTVGTTVAGGNGAGTAMNQFSYPSSVYGDGNGHLFVADLNNFRVQQFPIGANSTTNGTTVIGQNGWGVSSNSANKAFDIYVDGGGNIYVSNVSNNWVEAFYAGTATGVIVAGGNDQGAVANQFYSPAGIYVDGHGNLYVADRLNNRVQKFPPGSSNYTFATTVAGGNGAGRAASQLDGPTAVSVDGKGDIYVADYGNNRIQKFLNGSKTGITIAGGNGPGKAADQLQNPGYLFVDGDTIYVSDAGNNRIQKFSPMKNYTISNKLIPTIPGLYTAVVTDTSGCSFTTNAVLVSSSIKPKISIIASKPYICEGSTVSFFANDSSFIAPATHQWMVNGHATGSDNKSLSISSLINGDAISCILLNGSGCNGADTSNTIIANVKPLPTVGMANNIPIMLGQSAVLYLPVSGNIASYLWNPAASLSSNTIAQPVASPYITTLYSLQVLSADGCSATGSIKVVVYSDIFFPTAFTPNGDGRNDVFFVLGGFAGDKIKNFSIFDRWGKRLFQVQNVLPNDKSVGWDGRLNGETQQQGSYVYTVTIVSASGTERIYKGTVILVR